MGKLVRDKIPSIIKKNKEEPVIHKASKEEYWEMLKEKLKEETNEFIEESTKEEMADILEVIDSICEFKKFDRNELERIKKMKKAEKGGFNERIILEEVENQEKIWDSIAKPWSEFKLDPIDEVVGFLSNKRGKILDFGCGNGKHFPYMKGERYGVDFSENMLKYSKQLSDKMKIKVDLRKANAWSLPFENNFFDSAIFVAVLHCIPNHERRIMALKELFRVLKPNAEAFITVWDKNQERFKNSEKESLIPWKYDGKEYMRYYYLYDKKEFLELLESVGFKIIKISDSESPNGFYSKRNIDVIMKKI